jgi:hypothetical protein
MYGARLARGDAEWLSRAMARRSESISRPPPGHTAKSDEPKGKRIMPRRNKQNNPVIDYRTLRDERARLEMEYAALVAEVAAARAKKRPATTKPKARAKKATKKGGEMNDDAVKFSDKDAWYMLDQSWLTDEMKALVCKTIARLPLDVQDFAIHNCTFIDFSGKENGSTWPAPLFTHLDRRGRTMRNHWLIILNCTLIKNEKAAQFTIAHEIAHARLGHQIAVGFLREEEADALVESWGFVIPKHRLKVHAECRRAMESMAARGLLSEDDKAQQARARASMKGRPSLTNKKKTAKKAKKGGAK